MMDSDAEYVEEDRRWVYTLWICVGVSEWVHILYEAAISAERSPLCILLLPLQAFSGPAWDLTNRFIRDGNTCGKIILRVYLLFKAFYCIRPLDMILYLIRHRTEERVVISALF